MADPSHVKTKKLDTSGQVVDEEYFYMVNVNHAFLTRSRAAASEQIKHIEETYGKKAVRGSLWSGAQAH